MPYVNVHVDADEVLSDLSDKELLQELKNRKLRGPNESIPHEEAKRALDEASYLFRRMQRFDLAYKMDEIKADHF